MAIGPPQSKEDWLYATIHGLATAQEAMMATLAELLAKSIENESRLGQLEATEGAQVAAIEALAGLVHGLIDIVTELRVSLSPEEQAVVDEAMASQTRQVAKIEAMLTGSGMQSAALSDLSAAVDAADDTPAPPPAPTP